MTLNVFNAPRDARQPLSEQLVWSTDVQVARRGAESRRALRAYPRQTISFDVLFSTPSARVSLDLLRTGGEVLVPLWQHAFERPDTVPDAGLAPLGSVLALTHTGTHRALPRDGFSWPLGFEIAAPAARARILGNQQQLTHVNGRIAQAKASFQLLSFDEDVTPYPGGSLDLDTFRYAFVATEQIDTDANEHDTGTQDGLYEARYQKRSFSVAVTLRDRAEIVAFRQFLFAVRGRLSALTWTPPFDSAPPRLWRLASDTVEISYLRPSYATCTLSLVEL